jgi:hypothetical protein
VQVRLVGMAVLVLAGCYTLKPAGGVTPEVGTKVAFAVNDAGRVALGGSMGPEVAQVEGQLLEMDSATYLVAVSGVRTIRGDEQVWSGEQVRLKPEHVAYTYKRKFSAGRSIGLGVVTVGGFAALLATRSLLGFGSTGGPGDEDTAHTRLIRP